MEEIVVSDEAIIGSLKAVVLCVFHQLEKLTWISLELLIRFQFYELLLMMQ